MTDDAPAIYSSCLKLYFDNAAMEANPPKPKRRPVRLREPCGLLAKTNSRASLRRVVRHAIIGAIVGPVLYGALIYFRAWFNSSPLISTDYLAIKLGLCSLSFAFIAGLCEWQIDESDEG